MTSLSLAFLPKPHAISIQGRVNPEVVSRLLENRRFAQLTSMIALYFDETMASGFAAQNQILQSLSSMLLMTGKEQPDIRKATHSKRHRQSLLTRFRFFKPI